MNFPTITIPDPAAVGKWLDDELPDKDGIGHQPMVGTQGWSVCHYESGQYTYANGKTPDELLADLYRQLKEHDPLAKLRKEWESLGCPELKKQD